MRFNPWLAFFLAGVVIAVLAFQNISQPAGLFTQPSQPLTAPTYTLQETNYIYGPNGLAFSLESSVPGSEARFYHQDRLGSTRGVSDSGGNPVFQADYRPFGQVFNQIGQASYKFTGEEEDQTGLDYFGARYYSPELGRFTQADPKMNPAVSAYTYAAGNPLKYIDTDGLQPEEGEWEPVLPQHMTREEHLQRVPSYSEFVRDFPVRKGIAKSYWGSGFELRQSNIFEADNEGPIVDIPIFCSEMQCADIQVYLMAEYQNRYFGDARLTLSSGEEITWSGWGENPASEKWGREWRDFLRYAFTYTGTDALKRDLEPITFEELKPGDILVSGHTMVLKEIFRKGSNKEYRLFYSSDPPHDPYIDSFTEQSLKSFIGFVGMEARRYTPE